MEALLPPVRLPCARCIAQLSFSSCTQLSVFTLSELWEHCAVEHSGLSPLFRCSLCSFSSFSPFTATKHSAVCAGNCSVISTAPSPLANVQLCESIVDDSLRIFLRSTSAAVADTRPSNRERDAETDTLGAQSEGVEQEEEKEKEQPSDTIESALLSIKQEPPEGPVEEAEKPKEPLMREKMREKEKVVAEKEKEKKEPRKTSKSAPLTLHIKKEPIEDPSSEKSGVAERAVGEGLTRKEKRKERKRRKQTEKQQSSLFAPETTKRVKQEIIHPVNEKEVSVEQQKEKVQTPAAKHIITRSICTVKETEQDCTAEEEEKTNTEPERRESSHQGMIEQQVIEKEQNEEKEERVEKTGQKTAKEQTTKCGEKPLSAETAVSVDEPLPSVHNVTQVEHHEIEEKKSEERAEPQRVTPADVVGLEEKEQEEQRVVVEQLTEKVDPLFLKVEPSMENESSGGVDEGMDWEEDSEEEEEEEDMPPPYNYDSEGTIEVSDDEEEQVPEPESPPCEIDVIVLSSDDEDEMERLKTAPPTPPVYCPDRVKPEPVDNYSYRTVDVTVKMEPKQETKTRRKRKRRIDTMEGMSVAREVREGQARLFNYEWNKLERRECGREERRVVGGEKAAPMEKVEVEDYVDRGPPKRFKIVECGEGKDRRRESADSGVSLNEGKTKRKRDEPAQKRVYGRGAIAERNVRGTVLIFHRSNYTFIERTDSEGKPVFVHVSELPGILPGTWVVFDTEWDMRKAGRRLCACNVRPVCM